MQDPNTIKDVQSSMAALTLGSRTPQNEKEKRMVAEILEAEKQGAIVDTELD